MKTIILALVVLMAQVSPIMAQAVGVARPEVTADYTVGVKDVLTIVIHGFEEMSLPSVIVDSDGTIEYPLLGRIRVAAKTPRVIEDEIKKKFMEKAYLTNPSVTVSVKEFRSKTVHVQGEVRAPGTYPMKGDAGVMKALSDAGSFTASAGTYITIVRMGNVDSPSNPEAATDQQKIRITRDELYGARGNTRLQDGDTILVPKADIFFVTGQVKSPNEYVLRPDLTVIQAITLAGGYTDRANKRNIEVERVVNGKSKKVKVKEGDFVKAGDTINVKQRFW
ncbi:MAG TPA: polysaccharide biosynthesis/export family protein [Vicinamibacterales bacterium]|nr:polysaccharide biosynthesis/export family protein [Vicinamibacterales bacterium]